MSNGRRNPWLSILVAISIFAISTWVVILVIRLFGEPKHIWDWFFQEYDLDNRIKYLLSASAQVLGALFALAFSITLIAAQFLTKYTSKIMPIVFNKKVILYTFVFALVVIQPLWWLFNPSDGGAVISIGFASIFVISLIPFVLYLRERMNVEGLVRFYKREVLQHLKRNKVSKVKQSISSLDDVGMRSFILNEFEIFGYTESALTDLMFEIENRFGKLKFGRLKENTIYETTHNTIYEKLWNTSLKVIEDVSAPVILAERLGSVGAKAVAEGFEKSCYSAFGLIMNIESRSREKQRIDLSAACTNALHQINMNGARKSVKGNFAPVDCYSRSTYNTIQIQRYHMNQGWETFLQVFLSNMVELITIQFRTNYIIVRYSIEHLFEYGDFFIEKDDFQQFRNFNDELFRLIKQIKSDMAEHEIQVGLFWIMLEKLDGFGTKCQEKENEMWHLEATRLFERLADISNIALEARDFKLLETSQHKYSSALTSKFIEVSLLLRTLIKQTESLIELSPNEFSEKWASQIVDCSIAGFKKLIENRTVVMTVKFEEVSAKSIWKEAKPVMKNLKEYALSHKWNNVLKKLDELFELENTIGNLVLPSFHP